MNSRWGKRLRRVAVLALALGAATSYGQARAEPQTVVANAAVVAMRIVTEDGRVLSESPAGIAVEI
ncbi:MAG: hypothetical protein WBE10_12815, partial [Candidatus Acidiferrum sp.]